MNSVPDTVAHADAPVADAVADDADKPGMVEQLRGLYADGRELVEAEIGFQKARLAAAGKQVRNMAALAFVGLVLLGCSLIALVVGTMIALIPHLGPWGAMTVTALGSLALAGLSFWLAAGRVGKLTALFASEDSANGAAPDEEPAA